MEKESSSGYSWTYATKNEEMDVEDPTEEQRERQRLLALEEEQERKANIELSKSKLKRMNGDVLPGGLVEKKAKVVQEKAPLATDNDYGSVSVHNQGLSRTCLAYATATTIRSTIVANFLT
jgi:hypothetical protein